MKTFTRYDAEHHDPATRYVLAEEAEAAALERVMLRVARDALLAEREDQLGELGALRTERDALQRQLDLEHLRHAATRAELEDAPTYPVENPANPLLTVESGGIRYVLEVRSDEDGEWFEVKSATPTEPQTLADFTHSARPERRAHIEAKAREALAAYRAEQREDDEASRAY